MSCFGSENGNFLTNKNASMAQVGSKRKLRPQSNLWPGGDWASIGGSHDGAPTKNDRKRTKPAKAEVLALHFSKWDLGH
jgi:hypothetical protein